MCHKNRVITSISLKSDIEPEYRRYHQRCYVKMGVLRNFAKFTGKDLCQSLFFNKVAGRHL